MDLLQVLDQSLYKEAMAKDLKSLTNPSPMKNLSSQMSLSYGQKESRGLKRKLCGVTTEEELR